MSVALSEKSEFPTSYEQYNDPEKDWPYDVAPLDPSEHDDAITWQGLHEFAFKGEDGGVYAGCYARSMINNAANIDDPPLMIGASDRGNQSVGILHKERYRHVFCGGATGNGKTVAAKNGCQQDAFSGHGFCFIDPGGEDILDIVRSLPDYRLDDLIYMEPGNEYRSHSIGLNYLDTLHEPGEPGFKKECESIATNLLPMLNADQYARMKGVALNMLRYLIKANHEDGEYEYTLIDLYYMLGTEEARQKYANKVQQSKLEFLKPYATKIAELADDDLEPLIRRLQSWVENDVIRPFIAQRNSDFSIGDAVANQRIMLVKANIGKNEREMITAALTTKLWAAITSRPNEDEQQMMEYEGVDVPDIGGSTDDGDHQPYFLVADEFHAVANEHTDIGEMLKMARKKRLGLYLLTQQLNDLPSDTQEHILGNCSTIMAFDPGRSSNERRALAGGFDGIEDTDLVGIGRYKFWTTITDREGDESQAFLTHSTPPYPPLRSVKEANEVLNYAQRKHGSERLSDEEIINEIPDEFSPEAARAAVGDVDGDLEALLGNEHAERRIIKTIYDAGIRHGNSIDHDSVPSDLAHEAVASAFDDLSMTQLSDLIEQLSVMDLLGTSLSNGDTYVSVTLDGLKRLGLKSGSGGSGGGSVHRELLRRMYIEMVRLGYDTDIPTQSGDELADAVGDLPSEINHSDMGLSEALEHLRDEYPAITELSDDGNLIVEAESSGLSKPAGPIKNFAKANRDRHQLLFAVAEAGADGIDNARQLANIFTKNRFTSNRPPADVARKFYTKNHCPAEQIDSSDAEPDTRYAICPVPDASTSWVEHDDGTVVCRTSDGGTIAQFEDYEAFASRSPEDFPGMKWYDDDSNVHIAEWTDAEGTTQRIKRDNEPELRKEVSILQYPRIPELVFGGAENVPTPAEVADQIEIVIVPDEPEARDAAIPQLAVYDIQSDETTPLDAYLGIDVDRPTMGEVATESHDGGESDTSVTSDDEGSNTDVTREDPDGGEEELSFEERLDALDLPDELTDGAEADD